MREEERVKWRIKKSVVHKRDKKDSATELCHSVIQRNDVEMFFPVILHKIITITLANNSYSFSKYYICDVMLRVSIYSYEQDAYAAILLDSLF